MKIEVNAIQAGKTWRGRLAHACNGRVLFEEIMQDERDTKEKAIADAKRRVAELFTPTKTEQKDS